MVKRTLLRAYGNGPYTILTLTPEFENIDTIDIAETDQVEGRNNICV